MALNIEDKKGIVAGVNEHAKNAVSAAVADYRGLTVEQMTELRSTARKSGLYLHVIRNTLLRRAFKDTDLECLHDSLVGPTLLAMSAEDPGSVARLFKDFMKENDKLSVRAIAVSGQMYEAKDLGKIAKLPTRDEALAKLMGMMQAPIAQFVRTVAAPHAKFVRTLAAVRDQKQQSA